MPSSAVVSMKGRAATKGNGGDLLRAVDASFATIEFDADGIVLSANDVFCSLMGYAEEEIQGKHHRTFVDSETAASLDYRRFWEELRGGKSQSRGPSSASPRADARSGSARPTCP